MNNFYKFIFKTLKSTFFLSGRASRKEFNIFYLFFHIYAYILYFFQPTRKDVYSNIDKLIALLLCVLVILGLIATLSLFSLIIRRIHDLNASAWWLLITLIPLGGLLFFALPFKKGTPGANKYGDPPEY